MGSGIVDKRDPTNMHRQERIPNDSFGADFLPKLGLSHLSRQVPLTCAVSKEFASICQSGTIDKSRRIPQ